MQTKKELVQEILYELYGGITSDEARLSERFVLTKVNNTIAFLAKKSAYETNNLEGVTYADDSFWLSFSALPVLLDDITGLFYTVLPAQPVGLPRQRSIQVYPLKVKGGMRSDMFKPISINEVQRMTSLPPIPNKVFFYIKGGNAYFIAANTLIKNHPTVNINIVSADGGLTAPLNLPPDMVTEAKAMVLKDLRGSMMTPADLHNDGIEVTER